MIFILYYIKSQVKFTTMLLISLMECLLVSVVVEFAAGGSANNGFTPSSLCTYLTRGDHTQESTVAPCSALLLLQLMYCTVQYKYCTVLYITSTVLLIKCNYCTVLYTTLCTLYNYVHCA